MIETAKKILKRKHLLIIGKSEKERRTFISKLIEVIDYETHRFPAKMKSFEEYYRFMEKENLYSPWYIKKSYNSNQILDFHRDWISENNSLIIMEEFDSMEERWKVSILNMYLDQMECRKKGEKVIHLIISQETENGLIEKLSEVIRAGKNDRRTRRQIVEQNLAIVNIGEM